jgi:hypothetical protein
LALRKFAETGKQTDGRTKRNKDILKTDKKRKTAALQSAGLGKQTSN